MRHVTRHVRLLGVCCGLGDGGCLFDGRLLGGSCFCGCLGFSLGCGSGCCSVGCAAGDSLGYSVVDLDDHGAHDGFVDVEKSFKLGGKSD